MARYRLLIVTQTNEGEGVPGGVYDKETESCIPKDTNNRHWQEYQEWLKEGNKPDLA